MQAWWMILASFWFALMAVGIKFASVSFGTFELVFYRGVVSVIFMGILASLSQWCMTRAYRHGATLVVASMQYAGIVFASFFSLVLFGDNIAPIGWAGIAVIVTSGLLATLLRARALPQTPAEEH